MGSEEKMSRLSMIFLPILGTTLATETEIGRSSVTLCQFTIDALVSELSQESSLDEQVTILSPLCGSLETEDDIKECEKSLSSYWWFLAPELYSATISPRRDQICAIDHNVDDPCIECVMEIMDLSSTLIQDDVVNEMIALVQGDLFCNMDTAFWDVEDCQQRWAYIVSESMPRLGLYISDQEWSWSFCTGPVGLTCQ